MSRAFGATARGDLNTGIGHMAVQPTHPVLWRWPAAMLALLLAVAPARAQNCQPVDLSATAWPAATERDAAGRPLRRFIPPELYVGAPWQGQREIELRPVNVTRKPLYPPDHPPITAIFPVPLPVAPARMALQRSRLSGREGLIEQYFVVNERGDGLGRAADLRQHRDRSEMHECFKFPLGVWQQRETRHCRESTITIVELDFEYNCVPHSLQFRWNDENIYIYSPDRGMVADQHVGNPRRSR